MVSSEVNVMTYKTQADHSRYRSHAFFQQWERRSHAFLQIFNNGNRVPKRSPSKRPLCYSMFRQLYIPVGYGRKLET